jgi:hypothetical protein
MTTNPIWQRKGDDANVKNNSMELPSSSSSRGGGLAPVKEESPSSSSSSSFATAAGGGAKTSWSWQPLHPHLHPSDRNESPLTSGGMATTTTTTTMAAAAAAETTAAALAGTARAPVPLLRKIRDSHSIRRHVERRRRWEGSGGGSQRHRRPPSSSSSSLVSKEEEEEDESDNDEDSGDASFLRVARVGGADDENENDVEDEDNNDFVNNHGGGTDPVVPSQGRSNLVVQAGRPVDERTPLTRMRRGVGFVGGRPTPAGERTLVGRARSLDDSDRKGTSKKGNVGRAGSAGTTASSNRGRGWAVVRAHLKRGSFLLEGVLAGAGVGGGGVAGQDNNGGGVNEAFSSGTHVKSAATLRHEVIEEFHRGSTFSFRGAIFAIVLYLALSVLSFRFFLEPTWTIIDCCYFAVTTFTTNGAYVTTVDWPSFCHALSNTPRQNNIHQR